MPLVRAQCTSCGAALEVDESRASAVCPFCNMPYVIEKAVNQFRINNTFHIEKAVFESADSEDKLLKRGIAQLEMREYKDAFEAFEKMTKLYPANYRGWLGLVLADSEMNTECEESAQRARYRQNALYQCPEEEKSKLGNMHISSQSRIENLTERIRQDEELEKRTNGLIKEYEERLALYHKLDKRSATIKNISFIGLIFSPVFTLACLILFIKTGINACVYSGLVFLMMCVISFLVFRNVSVRNDNESTETETAKLLDGAKSTVTDSRMRIDTLKNYLEEVKGGESPDYYIELLKA